MTNATAPALQRVLGPIGVSRSMAPLSMINLQTISDN